MENLSYYTRDVFNRRLSKSIDADGAGSGAATVQRFVYYGHHIVMEFDGNNAGDLTHRYLHGPVIDQILADEEVTSLTQAGTMLWPLADNLGTVRDLVDSSATVLNHLKYDAYGKVTSESNTAVDFLFAFTGRERDEETGLQFHRARYYDSAVGRWISEDPIGFAAGDTNLSRYVGNESTNSTDPLGLERPAGPRDMQIEGMLASATNRPPRYVPPQTYSPFGSLYYYYLWNPTQMDSDLQIAQNAALGVSVGAVTTILIVTVLPAATNAGAYFLWTNGTSATTAVTVSNSAMITLVAPVGVYSFGQLAWNSYEAYQSADWNQLAFNGGLILGGAPAFVLPWKPGRPVASRPRPSVASSGNSIGGGVRPGPSELVVRPTSANGLVVLENESIVFSPAPATEGMAVGYQFFVVPTTPATPQFVKQTVSWNFLW